MHLVQSDHDNAVSTTVYGSRAAAKGIPRFEMGEEEMDPRLAKRFCQDELLMNGNPHLNLARCVFCCSRPALRLALRGRGGDGLHSSGQCGLFREGTAHRAPLPAALSRPTWNTRQSNS